MKSFVLTYSTITEYTRASQIIHALGAIASSFRVYTAAPAQWVYCARKAIDYLPRGRCIEHQDDLKQIHRKMKILIFQATLHELAIANVSWTLPWRGRSALISVVNASPLGDVHSPRAALPALRGLPPKAERERKGGAALNSAAPPRNMTFHVYEGQPLRKTLNGIRYIQDLSARSAGSAKLRDSNCARCQPCLCRDRQAVPGNSYL